MIAAWMLVVAIVGIATAVLARAMAWVAEARRWPARFIWLGAMFATTMLAAGVAVRRGVASDDTFAVAAAASSTVSDAWAPASPGVVQEVLLRARAIVAGAVVTAATLPAGVQRTLGLVWSLASLWVAWVLLLTVARMRRARRVWSHEQVDGMQVYVAQDGAPMVVGLRAPTMVLPRWVLALPESSRRLVLAHEQEHVRARDTLTLVVAALQMLLPWHPAMWWLWRRVTLAVECDCDRRVLARGEPTRAYGELLLTVAARIGSPRLLVPWPAMHGAPSSLEHRILTMTSSLQRPPLVRVATLTATAVLLVLAACERAIPTSAELERMDGKQVTRQALAAGVSDSSQFFLNGAPVSEAVIQELPADSIAQITINRATGTVFNEVRISTPRGVVVERVIGDTTSASMRATQLDSGLREIRLTRLPDSTKRTNSATAGARLSTRQVPLSDPQYVVDGRTVLKQELSRLNPADIESVEVIKGAAAVSRYGPTASNGVVLIRTKSPARPE
jgi:TonB-dependent SusC/RagA subfamily outer membrane receptor